MATSRTTSGAAWTGWIIFAASMHLIIGMFNILEGIIALVDDQRIVMTPNRLVVVDLTQWGWTILIFGLDVVVLFALCARWSVATTDLDMYAPESGPERPSQVGQHASLG